MSLQLIVIFYLATLFLPPGTSKFTVSSGTKSPVTFVREADGWHATEAAIVLSVTDLSVSIAAEGSTQKIDLSKHLKIDTDTNQKKQVTLNGRPLTVALTDSTITFSQGDGGDFKEPVVITFSPK